MSHFKNKVVWITGASSGIGKETAVQLNELGAKLILSARNVEELEKLKDQFARPNDVLVIPIDLGSGSDFKIEVEQACATFGRIDVLFNNAGVSQRSYLMETSLETDRKIMEINYFGTIALTKAVLPKMLEAGEGHIAVTSSVVGRFGYGVRSAYSAAKHALHGFFESLYVELNDRGIGITIVAAGPTQTDISKHAFDGAGNQTGEMDEMQEKGMPVDQVARIIIDSIAKKKREVIIGDFKTKLGVTINNLFPSLFFKIAKKQNPRGDAKF